MQKNNQITSYQWKVANCIDNKLTDFAMNKPCSLYDTEILYHHFLLEEQKLFHNPNDYMTKIMSIAYHKTIKELKR